MAEETTGATGNTDITTLAIALQSREAEAGLKNFNDLMLDASKLAGGWKTYKIDIDAQGALEQLRSIKDEYLDMVNTARRSMADMPPIDIHVNKPEYTANDPKYGMMVEGFRQTQEQAKLLHDEMSRIAESFGKLDEWTNKLDSVSSGYVRASSAVRTGTVVTEEYAKTMKEMTAAKKEFDAAAAKADAAGEAMNAVDERADAVKKRLAATQRELASVTQKLAATHVSYSGDVLGLSEREEYLKKKLTELKEEYAKTSNEVDKHVKKLDDSAAAADAAKVKYSGLKEKLEGMPPPVEKTGFSADKLSPKITRLTRGVNGLMSVTGSAIPGMYGLGQAMSMLSMATSPAGIAVAATGAAVAAGVAVYRAYAVAAKDASEMAQKLAVDSARNTESFIEQSNANQVALDRLWELNSYDTLYGIQKEESRRLVDKLTAAYKNLGLQYDETTGKVNGLSDAQERLIGLDREALGKKLEEQYKSAQVASTKLRDSIAGESVSGTRDFLESALWGLGATSSNRNVKTTKDRVREFAETLKGLDIDAQIKKTEEYLSKIQDNIVNGDNSIDDKPLSKLLEALRRELEARKAITEFQKNNEIPSGDDKKSSGHDQIATLAKGAIEARARMRELYDENGNGTGVFRLATEAELLEAQGKRLDDLIKKREELQQMKEGDRTTYDNKAMTAVEARLRVERDIDELTRQRLQYEERKQSEIIALRKKLEESRSGFVYDSSGNITRRKTQGELSEERNRQLAFLKEQLAFSGRISGGDISSIKKGIDPDKFNTKLNAEEEKRFQRWLERNKQLGYIHPEDSGRDYDFRGAFKAGYLPEEKGGHWTDTWKKPNHETFSNESQYAKGIYEAIAGRWDDDQFIAPGRTSEDELQKKRLEAEQKITDLSQQQFQEREKVQNGVLAEFDKMKNSLTQFRDTTQSAINADSIEGLRLQSRQMSGVGDHQKETADNTRKMNETLSSQENTFNTIASTLSNVLEKINEIRKTGA